MPIIAVDIDAKKLAKAKELGATHTVDSSTTDPIEAIAEICDKYYPGAEGADVVVEVVGYPAAIDEGLKMLAQFGRYVEIGNINMGKTFEFDPSRFVFSNKTMVGVSLYDPAVLHRAITFLEQYQDRLPFDRLAAAQYSWTTSTTRSPPPRVAAMCVRPSCPDREQHMHNYTRTELYIDGAWVAPQGTGTIEVIDPATEQPIGSVPAGNADDVDTAVAAARKAFDPLITLAERAGRVLTRDQIMEAVRGRELEAFDRSIDVHMGRIRAAIEADPKNPKRIVTVRGVGYVFAKQQD